MHCPPAKGNYRYYRKARQESANGRTILLCTIKEIKSYFSKMMANEV